MRPHAPEAPQGGGGSRLLQSAGALSPQAAPDRAGDPEPQRPAASARLRQGRVPRAQSGRAAGQPAQAVSPPRHPLREAGCQLPRHGHAWHDHVLFHMILQGCLSRAGSCSGRRSQYGRPYAGRPGEARALFCSSASKNGGTRAKTMSLLVFEQ